MSNTSKQHIADISFHLVFCFLSLKELSIISQCCKEWKRMVIEPSFLNIYRHNCVFSVVKPSKRLKLTAQSPFRHLIRNISTHLFSFQLSDYVVLTHFIRLESLECGIFWNDPENAEFDITPVFKALGPRLNTLTIRMVKWNTSVPPSFFHFQKALSFLSSLQSLKFTSSRSLIFTDMSFLSCLTKLKSFNWNDISSDLSLTELARNLSLCSNLISLVLDSFIISHIHTIRLLLVELKNLNLNHLGNFHFSHYFPKEYEYECVQLFNQLTNLQTIDIHLYSSNSQIPIFLSKWIRHLDISARSLSDQDVAFIHSLTHLKSLGLNDCHIVSPKMRLLMSGLSNQLENLCIKRHFHYYDNKISFQDISKIKNLKSIDFQDVDGLLFDEFDLLKNCKHLESNSN
jgi:hypothetical protein